MITTVDPVTTVGARSDDVMDDTTREEGGDGRVVRKDEDVDGDRQQVEDDQERQRFDSAVMIQRTYRRHRCQVLFRVSIRAAKDIQRVCRGHLGRQYVRRTRMDGGVSHQASSSDGQHDQGEETRSPDEGPSGDGDRQQGEDDQGDQDAHGVNHQASSSDGQHDQDKVTRSPDEEPSGDGDRQQVEDDQERRRFDSAVMIQRFGRQYVRRMRMDGGKPQPHAGQGDEDVDGDRQQRENDQVREDGDHLSAPAGQGDQDVDGVYHQASSLYVIQH